jgi:ElaB/YqjD/DUF883 family membrane-anchored ribosome-binding protein
MVDEPEVIRQQMEETRASLTEKLEALESQVAGTVQSTTEAVTETVEAVKETVENVTETVKETAHSVAETFNLKRQVERHPWGMLGGSVAVGCLAGYFLSGKPHRQAERNGYPEEDFSGTAAYFSPAAAEGATRPQPEPCTPAVPEREQEGQKSWVWDTVGRLKGLAIGTLMGVVRDLASRALPESLQPRIAEEIDHLTTSLGGEPIHGHLLPEEK